MIKSNNTSPKRGSPTAKSRKLPNSKVNQCLSAPDIYDKQIGKELVNNRQRRISGEKVKAALKVFGKAQREGVSVSQHCLSSPRHDEPMHLHCHSPRLNVETDAKGDTSLTIKLPDVQPSPRDKKGRRNMMSSVKKNVRRDSIVKEKGRISARSAAGPNAASHSPFSSSHPEDMFLKKIREIHTDSKKSARIIRQSRSKLLEIQRKPKLTEADIKEIAERNEMLLREMERFDRLTNSIQKLVGVEVANQLNNKLEKKYDAVNLSAINVIENEPNTSKEVPSPTILFASELSANTPPAVLICDQQQTIRSKSEIDLSRKLSESYDMQEKLVADNADLEVKRYILYKELMTKDQSLENCRAQMKRLQAELKLMSKENALLLEKINKNNPEGDATAMNQNLLCTEDCEEIEKHEIPDVNKAKELLETLESYKNSTNYLEHQLGELEVEIYSIRVEMESAKNIRSCRNDGGRNTCFEQPENGPPVPPLSRACGVCPPCPAPCNPNAPPTPAEKEVQRLTIVLKQTEENFKTKVTECAMLRADLCKRKEELEKERCLHRETQNKLRELEMKFEGLATHTNMMLGTKEQAFEAEVSVRALKQCYREAREEIDELRLLLKEQNEQLQDYRVKYLQAQQLVEEQRRQMDLMDMDNTRISEQINLEIQKVKIKFQEKLQELAPIPGLLKATQMRLKDAQQSQAIAEHNAEQLARELNSAREKVHLLLHNSVKPPEKAPEKGTDEKQMNMLQQKITQLTESNMAYKSEVERLKSNVIRMEECVLANEKRLQEKMHECAVFGGELDRARDEAARALQRANERTDTIRKCLQTTVAELERQLAATRAQVAAAEKEREELRCRMQCQIKRLNDNFEQAQYRVMGLQNQVQTLKRVNSSTGDGEGDQQECSCKTFFDNP